jgi:hypothetical protein
MNAQNNSKPRPPRGVNLERQEIIGEISLPDILVKYPIIDFEVVKKRVLNEYDVEFRFKNQDTIEIEYEGEKFQKSWDEVKQFPSYKDCNDDPAIFFHPLESGILFGMSHQRGYPIVFNLADDTFIFQKGMEGWSIIISGDFTPEGIEKVQDSELKIRLKNYYEAIQELRQRL